MQPGSTQDPAPLPWLTRLQALFDQKYRLSRALVGRAMDGFGAEWAADFESVLETFCADDEALQAAVKGYVAFAMDSMRRQKAFEASGAYPVKSYAQAADEVYLNDAHMMQEYLPGLLLSHFLWPHHYRQLRFFDTAFVAPMALGAQPRFAEVGVGTALYSRRLLSRVARATGAGYDISPSSCRFAERHLAAAGLDQRYTMHQHDVLDGGLDPVPWLVCVEVLEHLERPVEFLRALRAGLAPGGKAFITAALNAAHADHIYLYRSGEEVLAHLHAAGFVLEQSFVATAHAPASAGAPVPAAAAFVVC
ncbi:class I SAM-dependent methyltransferase [Rubrivivax benzoatilyticus]|uniref:Class I SAM-dependent methyltransferase n=1 Tax=Rubrivivax benzoatilyticus TaxID=316997 RepID=A0ABX0I186_9BURK|nr:class I SAM-dependent methyltransferase [Rubrivivax benzoatilyticus]EGJ11397.1 hypothetical protein RBXJA2T_13754 [Rubrivivax benzoatilyticus JA2 = ATCC BAA-35]NHK99897.1 class I SAM-dependent methyltransferase [Rubrivivax benzoatilyticus]NHL25824.1 class I SAM-dependent methyltransferase [Rubrivivax benzoatilyticus]